MEKNDCDLAKKYNMVYLEILMKYKDYIEEKEAIYVSQLPEFVSPKDQNVGAVVMELLRSFGSYEPSKDLADGAAKAWSYVNENIDTISIPLDFWQSPEETLKHMAGDLLDKAVLLCSMIIAMGSADAKVVICVKPGKTSANVYFGWNGGIISLDLEMGPKAYADRDELLADIGIGEEGTTAYEFDDKVYSDLS